MQVSKTAEPVVTLLAPADGDTTAPLQAYVWTGVEMAPRDAPLSVFAHRSGAQGIDRSLPRPVTFAWSPLPVSGPVAYTLVIGRRPELAAPVVVREVGDALRTEVVHLHLGDTYYWQVRARCARDVLCVSATRCLHTRALPPRWVHAPGITNLRDLGGWSLEGGGRIRQGLVYRSSEMNGHVEIRPEGRRVLEDELGIRTDLDLRGEGEPVQAVLNPARVRWVPISIRPYGEILHPVHHPGYRRIVELFAEASNYPILFHCWGGADRAGTVAWLIHALLGGTPDNLLKDYELTTQAIWGERRGSGNAYQTLLRVLAGFAPRGASPRRQAEGYLRSIGVRPATFSAIRRLLIDPAPKRAGAR